MLATTMTIMTSQIIIRIAGGICSALSVAWILMFISFYRLDTSNPQQLDSFAFIWALGAVLFMLLGIGLLFLRKIARIPFMIITSLAGGWFAFVIFAFSGEGGNVRINRLWALGAAVITVAIVGLFSSKWIRAGFMR